MSVFEIPLGWFITLVTFAVIGAFVVLIIAVIWLLYLFSVIVNFIEDKHIEWERKKHHNDDN